LNNINFTIPAGRVVGLIGPNGAGKTTLLKGILGLTGVDGDLQVLGLDPHKQRVELLEQVSFIADTATLPRWMRVQDLIEYVEGVHARFNRTKCLGFLAKTNIAPKHKVKELSKGMITQLHLALIMAIDSKLLVLDEPTLGLDIIYRKQFYESLLNDYYDEQKTILITTHQVEEIEGVLTDLMFIDKGQIILDTSMDAIAEGFVELQIDMDKKSQAMDLQPIHVRSRLGGCSMIYENPNKAALNALGKTLTPSLADLFVAKIQPQTYVE
jgi:ABC-2 type transport system ATP-binding protein